MNYEPTIETVHERMAGATDKRKPLFAYDEMALVLARLSAAEPERDHQMQAKLDAQMTLKLVVESIDLRFADLGNGWKEAAPKILARLTEIVDAHAAAEARVEAAEQALGEILDVAATIQYAQEVARRYFVARAALACPPQQEGHNAAAEFQQRVAEARAAVAGGKEAVLDYLVPGWRSVAACPPQQPEKAGE